MERQRLQAPLQGFASIFGDLLRNSRRLQGGTESKSTENVWSLGSALQDLFEFLSRVICAWFLRIEYYVAMAKPIHDDPATNFNGNLCNRNDTRPGRHFQSFKKDNYEICLRGDHNGEN